MKYGERYECGKRFKHERTYRKVYWKDYHTNDEGYGLWEGNKQILGTVQFNVAGCKTEKAAIAKVRNLAKPMWEGRKAYAETHY